MKKRLVQFLVVIFSLFLFVGCSSTSDTTSSTEDTSTDKVENGEVTFYVVRHGETMLNTTDRVQGWSDAVLTPEGEEVVEYAGKGLSDIEFSAAYSSDSGRAMQTANIILDENTATDVTLQTDSRLREFNYGTYEGESNGVLWNDVAASQGMSIQEMFQSGIFNLEFFANTVAELDVAKSADLESENWPAESYDVIIDRLTEGFTEIAEKESKNGDSNVLLVSHGMSISAFINSISPETELPQSLENASVNIIKYKDGTFTVESVNDMSYVEKGQE